jgi:N-acetyl-S-(2-succino)cysteine monooxygenase
MPKLVLNSIIRAIGFTQGAWRHPDATPERAHDLDYYQEIAAVSERGLFDGLFLANSPVHNEEDWHTLFSPLEPFTLLSALVATTEHIGLIATLSSSFQHPYQIARQAASLDHLSKGRAGINVVVSGTAGAAANFGYDDLPDHEERYARAHEFLEVLFLLWDSWGADALVLDKAAGTQADQRKIRPIDYDGKYFKVRGPLDIARSPQGRPVVFQAGTSDDGRQLAATWADAVYSAAGTIDEARTFRDDIHRRQQNLGRPGPLVKILPGLIPIVASTDAEAKALEDEISALNPPERSVGTLGERLGIDLGDVPLDDEFPVDRLPDPATISGGRSFHVIVRSHAQQGATLRQILRVTDAGNAHLRFVGSAEHVADLIEQWFVSGAADGFNLNPAVTPNSLVDFVDHVVPLLQSKGIYKREYAEGVTSRSAFA